MHTPAHKYVGDNPPKQIVTPVFEKSLDKHIEDFENSELEKMRWIIASKTLQIDAQAREIEKLRVRVLELKLKVLALEEEVLYQSRRW